MSANRFFIVSVVIALLAVGAFAARTAIAPAAVITAPESSYTQTQEEIIREYELGERYGEIPQLIDPFSPAQIQREYFLGERYGVTPQQYAAEQALREYWLGERYGQTP